MARKLIAVLSALALIILCVGCGETEPKDPIKVEITIVDKGVISLELYPDIAPKTVDNFVSLAKSGFYDGLTFHRIIDGFMMQGGDPDGDGTGGSDKEIKGEFAANGFKNDLAHERGVISMARAKDYNSASSQFFIMHADYVGTENGLDGQYAAFGRVTSGIEIVDAICAEAKPIDMNGLISPDAQPKIESIKVIE